MDHLDCRYWAVRHWDGGRRVAWVDGRAELMAVTVGIVSALWIEAAAMRLLIDDPALVAKRHDPNQYVEGWLPSADPNQPHRVVLALLPEDGTRNASAVTTDLFRSYPELECVVMCGIAAGIPNPTNPSEHVRLGDVVVATEIVSYGHVRRIDGTEVLRRPEGGISADLIRAANELRIGDLRGHRPWRAWLSGTDPELAAFHRPPDVTDRLLRGGEVVRQPPPQKSGHEAGWPKIHYGRVGSADVLLRDEGRRDELAARHQLLAVEMESSGIASAAGLHNRGWFVVRGISDYGENTGKSDLWHRYSALAAAAYVRALLGACPPISRAGPVTLVRQDFTRPAAAEAVDAQRQSAPYRVTAEGELAGHDVRLLDRGKAPTGGHPETSDAPSVLIDAYLATNDSEIADRLFRAVDALATQLGFDGPVDQEIRNGSIWRRARAIRRSSVDSINSDRLHRSIRHAFGLPVDECPDVDVSVVPAVAEIVAALAEVGDASILLPPNYLVVRYTADPSPVLILLPLSQVEMDAIEQDRTIVADPRQTLQKLAAATSHSHGASSNANGSSKARLSGIGMLKLSFCRRLGYHWRDVADYLEIPSHEQQNFKPQDEARCLWEHLERQNRLDELKEALDAVGRRDLAALFVA